MRTVVLRVVALSLLLLLALVGIITTRTVQRLPDTLIYYVVDEGATFTLEGVPRRLGDTDLLTRVKAQVASLVAGPTAEESARGLSSVVPAGVEVLGARLDDGVLTVDLSAAYQRGGGTASMLGRLNQVYYTLSQPADVEAVRIAVDGRVIDVFSGEGLLLEVPWVRAEHRGLPEW